ncbi:MAG: hypothetical protein ACRBFS_22390 [Aureispira sp.]
MKLLSILLFWAITAPISGQSTNYYWEQGIKRYSKDIRPNVFYLTLLNESIEDSTKNQQADQELLALLKAYDFTIEHQGFADDDVGFVFFRKLTFKKWTLSPKKLKRLYQLLYNYKQIQFFGPLIFDINGTINSGAGLGQHLEITFQPDIDQDKIDALVSKHQLTVTGGFAFNQETSREVVNNTLRTTQQTIKIISVSLEDVYGLEILHLTNKIQKEAVVTKVSNYLFIQETFG